jgi:hypothetical protein
VNAQVNRHALLVGKRYGNTEHLFRRIDTGGAKAGHQRNARGMRTENAFSDLVPPYRPISMTLRNKTT